MRQSENDIGILAVLHTTNAELPQCHALHARHGTTSIFFFSEYGLVGPKNQLQIQRVLGVSVIYLGLTNFNFFGRGKAGNIQKIPGSLYYAQGACW